MNDKHPITDDYSSDDEGDEQTSGDNDNIVLQAWTGIRDNSRSVCRTVVGSLPFKLPFAMPCLADLPRRPRRRSTASLPMENVPQPQQVGKYLCYTQYIKLEY